MRAPLLWPLLVLVALGLAGCGEDTLAASEARARLAWDQTCLQHGRRAEILPALLDAVRAGAPQEREVVAEAAAALQEYRLVPVDEGTPTDPARWREHLRTLIRLSDAVQRLLGTVERYLDLKRSAGYLALRAQLLDAQDRAAVARGDYNAAARDHNAELEGWWSGPLARLRHPGARPLQLFTGLPTVEP